MDTNKLKADWNYPTRIMFGCGRISELPAVCQSMQIKAPLLVTDAGLADLPMIQAAINANNNAGIPTGLFSDIKANPNGTNVEAGVARYQQGKHDAVIAFGGGSALDAGKAIALMTGQTQPLWDFEDIGDNWTRVNEDGMAKVIAIPTTSGTGSEVGRASVIVDEAQHVKKIIFHPLMLPQRVIADPALTVGLPPHITAATGMDALSHNLEAYCSPGYHPMADGIAIEAMRLIKEWLIVAYNEPENLTARSHMMAASSMGATAFQKGLGAMHALAHPLGALYDAHHGLLNAIVMPYVLERNRAAIENKMQHLARCLDLEDVSFDGMLNYIKALRSRLGIPDNLQAIGIDDQKKQLIGQMARADASAGGNPIDLSAQDYEDLFLTCLGSKV
jgi:alcohol dehydrogenase class IV